MSFEIGATVGPYEIVEKLGKGGMATVYKAYHPALDRHVAIKVLHPAFKDDDSFLRRFAREARVVARLEHPHIVPVYDFAEHQGYPYLVMRYIEGETLKDRLIQGTLSPTEIAAIVTAVAEGLDYAHGQGVLHRDIKPSNVLLAAGGRVYLTDFGLARLIQAGESTLSQDVIMGTPQYISPEQAKGQTDLDGRTDVYSLGIVLYEMVTGQVPFQSDTSYSVIHAHIFEPPPRPSSLNQEVSPALEAVLLRALSKEPVERYAIAGELATAFREAALGVPAASAQSGADPLPDPIQVATPVVVTSLGASEVATTETGIIPMTVPAVSLAPPAAIPSASATTVVAQPARRRSLLLLGLGILVGMLLCGGLVFGLTYRQRLDRNQANATSVANVPARVQADEPAADAPVTNSLVAAPADGKPTTPAATANPVIGDSPPGVFIPPPGTIRSIEEVQQLLQTEPDNPQLKAELAIAYLRAGHTEDARAIVRELFRQTRLPAGYLVVAERLLEVDEIELAITILEEGYAKFSNDPRIQHLLMMAYIVDRQPEPRVQEFIDRLVRQPGGRTSVTIEIGEAYVSYLRGDTAEALQMLNALLDAGDNAYRADVLYLQGLLYLEMGDEQQALNAFEAAARQQPLPWLATRIEANIIEYQ